MRFPLSQLYIFNRSRFELEIEKKIKDEKFITLKIFKIIFLILNI